MKTWIKTNFYKITSIVSLFLATIGLIIGSIANHKTNDLQYFLDYDDNVHWGGLYGRDMRKKKPMIFIR